MFILFRSPVEACEERKNNFEVINIIINDRGISGKGLKNVSHLVPFSVKI